ncbi:MAG TPA: FAD-dependent oxidoreductase [Lacibacter sp.]|nr:FAD-dependent oxidoreductase [Lacibacter sp.]HMO89159.1 FAD-dependent oxidoreductase [Lacibacter sp.]
MLRNYYTVIFLTLLLGCSAGKELHETDVLVIGGGTGGSAAGIQAARMGVATIIAEPTVWLGGMFSAAGVAAFDGNHNMPSGLFGEFREKLYKVYGGPQKVATGWVSNTLFEPRVGDSIVKQMVAALPNLKVLYRHRFEKTLVNNQQVTGAVFTNEATGATVIIKAKQVIDATELGDVLASAGVPYDMGMEASSVTGEDVNVPETNDIIQDMTYAAILKDYGPQADCTIVKPANYDPMEFDGCCNEFCSEPSKLTSNVDARKMLDYGKLPNGKYMINWPGKGNDIYINMIPMNQEQRQQAIAEAKAKTLRFLYFLQTQFGFKRLALADDEFPSNDRLPLIPYHRESRRVHGLVRFKVQHIATPFTAPEALYRTGIAVGDYPIDHHHRENPKAPQHLNFFPVPSFNMPLGTLIPKDFTGIIIAEKSTSVSNVVNGTTRLQPCVLLTGQAAGTLAALAVKEKKPAAEVPVRMVQDALLKAGAYIMPYYDVKPQHPHFLSIQKIGATGILRGRGEPYLWANRTWFVPDSTVQAADFVKHMAPYAEIKFPIKGSLTIADAVEAVWALAAAQGKSSQAIFANREALLQAVADSWAAWGCTNFMTTRPITRAELAVLLDKTVDPFASRGVNHKGELL